MTEAQNLAHLMERSHAAVLRQLELLKDKDLHHRPEVDGVQLNSAFWIVAHLAVSQNWLVLRGTDGPFRKFSWAKQFSIGSTPPPAAECPDLERVMEVFEAVHQAAVAHVAGLDEDALSSPHQAMMQLANGNAMRDIVAHHLLHESAHCGQLGWLCKLHGIPMI